MLSDVAKIIGAVPPQNEREVTGYSIDSRTLTPGDLFFAVRGSKQDGHQYVRAALEHKASGAVVRKDWAQERSKTSTLLAVDDPVAALGRLAREVREQWNRPLVAVTGSNGKTTTKELIAAALGTAYPVARSKGNLNNELGLPLSLLRFDEGAEVGVVEMGMNHAGEIERLARIAQPTVGIVTNVNAVHLENFCSVDEIASAKRELIEGLPPDGAAVLNADDDRVAAFAQIHGGRVVTFGRTQDADFWADEVESRGLRGVRFRLRRGMGRTAGTDPLFESALAGIHNVSNILAAIATASLFDIDAVRLQDAVAAFGPSGMRGEVLNAGGVVVLNDCYNSNPAAAVQMLRLLRESEAERRIAVLGEMLELGETSPELHRLVGRNVAQGGIDVLVTVAREAEEIAEEAVRCGFPASHAHFFPGAEQAGEFVASVMKPGDVVLLKGSRGVGLERALKTVIRCAGVRDDAAAARN